MRRSLAPSQKTNILQVNPIGGNSNSLIKPGKPIICNPKKNDGNENNKDVVITRMPMFGFLEIPDTLRKQFTLPSGCKVTQKTLELRKVKRLGPPKNFQIVRPGDQIGSFSRPQPLEETVDEELAEEEELPVSNLPPFEPLVLWMDPDDPSNKIEVIPQLACKLRPHQREGVQFLFECTMGLRGFEGNGCILADDMGLGKTLMSITTMWTLLNQGMKPGQSAVKKVMVVCPTSLVGNWDNEIRKWVGDSCPVFAVKTEPKKMIKNYLTSRQKSVLIISYETQRLYSKMFETSTNKWNINPAADNNSNGICDLLICDEAHKLKNAESGLSKSLNLLPVKRRILLSGTPMQNELEEFYNMVNFCNPNILGSVNEFRKKYERPILAAREPDALESELQEAAKLQKELSIIVNEFILKRGNILNAQHLPPKLVQFVCCRLTPLQEALYERLLSSKEIRHIREGKQTNTLNSIRNLINICSHPKLILETYQKKLAANEPIDDDLKALVELIPKTSFPSSSSAGQVNLNGMRTMQLNKTTRASPNGKVVHMKPNFGGGSLADEPIDPEQSGKMTVLYRMMQAMRATQNNERIVIVSNYTSTLDLIESMCKQNRWPVLRLDGTITSNKRTKLVEEFNNPMSNAFAFLLSSKAGGCGINLIGGNRLVLFDPDWNPASDKQAAGRIWREGQKKRCFIYRFMSTGSIEEKIIQRQLSKEGLTDIVDDKEQVNTFSTEELKQLFQLRKETKSDTHDTLKCSRCLFMKKYAQQQQQLGGGGRGKSVMNENQKNACLEFLTKFESFLMTESSLYQKRLLRRENSVNSNQSNPVNLGKDEINQELPESFPFHPSFQSIREQLNHDSFSNLTQFSRKQREIIQSIEKELNEAQRYAQEKAANLSNGQPGLEGDSAEAAENSEANQAYCHLFPSTFSIYSEFLKQWTDLVPSLMALPNPSSTSLNQEKKGEDDDPSNSEEKEIQESFVEQEGCPEETDFNKWSHHCYAITCDDELFAKALGDDLSLVSFIFGLEINFKLLEMKEAETKDENLRKKEQMKKDLEELNARRKKEKLKKQKKEQGIECSSSDDEKEADGDDIDGAGDPFDDEIDPVDGIEGKKKKTDDKKTKGKKGKGEKKEKKEKKTSKKEKRRQEEDELEVEGDGSDDGEDLKDFIVYSENDEDEDEDDDNHQEAPGANKENIPQKLSKSSADSYKKAPMLSLLSDEEAEPAVIKKSKEKKKKDKEPSGTGKEKLKKRKQLDDEDDDEDVLFLSSEPPMKTKKAKNSIDLSSPPTTTINKSEKKTNEKDSQAISSADLLRLIRHPTLSDKNSSPSKISFDQFWSIFHGINDHWKMESLPDKKVIFTKNPQLKTENIAKYLPHVDYYPSRQDFLAFLLSHLRSPEVIRTFSQDSLTQSIGEQEKLKGLERIVAHLFGEEMKTSSSSSSSSSAKKNANKKSVLLSDEDENGEEWNLPTRAPVSVPIVPEELMHFNDENEAYFTTFPREELPVIGSSEKKPKRKNDALWSSDEENAVPAEINKNSAISSNHDKSDKKAANSPDLRTQPSPSPMKKQKISHPKTSQSSQLSSQVSSESPLKPRGVWSCAICTFDNKRHATKCKMCQTERLP